MKHKLKTGILMTSIAVVIIHIINHCINTAAVIKNLLSKESGSFFDWRFGKVFYTKTGSGTPLLLIHDLSPCSSSYEWNGIVRNLSKNHTVYCVDLPGCGRSDKPDLTYTNYFFVQFLKDFVNEIIGKKTDIAAAGLSSSFVIMACHMNPDLFDKVVMINPLSISRLRQTPGKYSGFVKGLMNLPVIGTAIYNIYVSKENIEYQFTENYFYNPFLVKKKLLHVYYESAHLGNNKGKYLLSCLHGCYVNADITKALKENSNKIYLLEGNKMTNGKEIVDNYLKINNTIQVTYLKDVKLYPQFENPDILSENLSKIL